MEGAQTESRPESLLHPLLAMPTWANDFSFLAKDGKNNHRVIPRIKKNRIWHIISAILVWSMNKQNVIGNSSISGIT